MEEKLKYSRKYDFYINFCDKDLVYAQRIMDLLSENNLTCFYLKQDIEMSGAFIEQSNLSIRNANAVIILLSNNFLSSTMCRKELQEIIKGAQGADREIIPVCLMSTVFRNDDTQVEYLRSRYGFTFINEDIFEKEINELATIYKNKFIKKVLYEKLNSYLASNSHAETYKTIKEICAVLPREFDLITKYHNESEFMEYVSLLKILNRISIYNESSKEELKAFERALSSFNVISKIPISKKLLKINNDILLVNLAIYLYITIVQFYLKDELMAIVSNDLAPYGEMYKRLPKLRYLKETFYYLQDRGNRYLDNVNIQVKTLISEVNELLAGNHPYKNYGNEGGFNLLYSSIKEGPLGQEEDIKDKEEEGLDELERQLFEVARHINKGNEIFQKIADKEATHEFLNCLKTSYERLRSYCELVGCKKVANYCIEKLSKINLKLLELKEDEAGEGLKENCFKALLGFTLPSSGRYDVFISYKHEDDDIAANVHAFLKQNLVNAFYDKVTLPKLGKSEYHEAIMDSIDRSDNFIVILSDLQYLKADWVKLEMSTFHTEMSEGRKPGANFIMIVTPEIYDEIIDSNKMCLSIEYRRCEIMKTTEYREKLLSYINTIK